MLAGPMPDEPQLELWGETLGDLVELSPGQTREKRLHVLFHPGGTSDHRVTDVVDQTIGDILALLFGGHLLQLGQDGPDVILVGLDMWVDRIDREFALALVVHLNGSEVVIDRVNEVHQVARIVVQRGVKILLHIVVDFGLRLAVFLVDELQVLH